MAIGDHRCVARLWSAIFSRLPARGLLICALLAFGAAPGCARAEKGIDNTVTEPPVVHIIRPELRKIVRIVGQPSIIETREQSSVFLEVAAYIENWNVDIGDRVDKGDTLAILYVPEMVKETRAILDKYEAEVERWDSEVKRLEHELERGIVDPQILLELTNQLKASVAARAAAAATVSRATTVALWRESSLEKDKPEVEIDEVDLSVAVSVAKRTEAWVGCLKLRAPVDGVVVARNANTFDFVRPATGDPTAMEHSPHVSHRTTAAPICVIGRLDTVRISVDIPEQDASYVQAGTKATVVPEAYSEEPIVGKVAHTSRTLNIKNRTLRAEIDLANPKSQLLPGMYVYAKVIIERPNVRALPLEALSYRGKKTYCWQHENGKAKRTEVRTGVSDGKYIEITRLQRPSLEGGDSWTPVSGAEEVILGNLSVLADGGPVEVLSASDAEKNAAKVRDEAQPESHPPESPQGGSPQPAAPRAETGSQPQAN